MSDADDETPERRAEHIVQGQLLIDFPAVRAELADADYCYALGYLCLSYAEDLRYREAVETGLLAVRTTEELAPGDDALLGHVRLNLGVAYSRSGDLERGVPLYLDSWSHAGRAGDDGTRLNAARNVMAALEGGHAPDARTAEALREVAEYVEHRGMLPEFARVHRLLGEVELAAGRPAAAVVHLERALGARAILGGQRVLRRAIVTQLVRAESVLAGSGDPGPPLGPGVRLEVRDLVADGVENLRRESHHLADPCFERAVTLLHRRREPVERALLAYLLLLRSSPDAAAAELKAIGDRDLVAAVRRGVAAGDLDVLSRLAEAFTAAAPPARARTMGRLRTRLRGGGR